MDDIFRSYILPAVIAAVVALVSSISTAIVTYKTTKQREDPVDPGTAERFL